MARQGTHKERWTDIYLARLPSPEKGNKLYFDSRVQGLAFRVTAAGHRAFAFDYRVEGRQRRMTIGEFPTWSATTARQRARELRRDVDVGIDPLGQREARQGALTLKDVCDDYLKHHAVKKRSYREDERIMRTYVIPELGRLIAENVHRRDIVRLLDRIATRAPIMANRVLACLRKAFNVAIERGLLEHSPCVHIKAPGREVSRERVLSDDEIRTFWERLNTARMEDVTKRALKLILVTGQRPGEVRSMHCDEIQSDWRTIPADKTKNGNTHRVPLTELARELIGEPSKGHVFHSTAKLGYLGETALNRALRLNLDHIGIEHFTPHDLRRTVGTRLGELGFNRLIQDKVLNHKDRGIGGVYDRYSYDREKRQALEAWERKLLAIILHRHLTAWPVYHIKPRN